MAKRVSRRLLLLGFVAIAAVAAVVYPAHAKKPSVYQDRYGVAIDGTDPVAYFTEGRPVAGSPRHTADWNGATWHFSTAANRDAFVRDPSRFAPQFGGYCAWAVAQGHTASSTPEAWAIVNNKLYLNYSPEIQRRWERDAAGHISNARSNWPRVLN